MHPDDSTVLIYTAIAEMSRRWRRKCVARSINAVKRFFHSFDPLKRRK